MERNEIVRPLVWIGFTAFGTLIAASFFGASYTGCFFLACLIIGFILFLTKYRIRCRYAILLLMTAAFFFGYYTLTYQHKVEPYSRFAGEEHPIKAEILSLPEESNGKFYYKARVYAIGEFFEPTDFTVRLTYREALDAEITDTVQCAVKFFDFETRPGLSSMASSLAKSMVLGAYITDKDPIVILSGERSGLNFRLAEIRTQLNSKISASLPLEEASVLSAMLIGMRDSIPDELNENYRTAGASHILVISGMHMSILVQFLMDALVYLGLRRRYAILLTYPAVLLFMGVSGFSPSVLRSGIMQIIWLTGLLIGRKPDSLNSLAIAALILVAANPFATGDISFLLSFSASLGMITISPRLVEFCTGRIEKPLIKHRAIKLVLPITSSVAAVLGAVPVQLYAFGTLNVLSVFTSLLVLSASAWIIRLGMPAVILLSIPFLSSLASPVILAAGLLIRYQNFVIKLISRCFPDPLYIAGSFTQSLVLILILFLLIIRWIFGNKPLPAAVYALAAALILCAVTVNHFSVGSETKLLILNNDYAKCIAVQQDKRAVIFSCSGNCDTVSAFLRDHGTSRINWLIVGTEESEIRCAEKLCDSFNTENILLPDSVYFPAVDFPYIYRYGITLPISDDETVYLSSNGDLIDFEIFGNRITINTNQAAFEAKTADILITDKPNENIQGDLTVIYSDKSYNDLENNLTDGSYLFTSEHEALCLCFTPDGTYTVTNG